MILRILINIGSRKRGREAGHDMNQRCVINTGARGNPYERLINQDLRNFIDQQQYMYMFE